MTHTGKRDANESDIVATLRACGASVVLLAGKRGLPDLLVGRGGETCLIEIKTADGVLSPDQVRFHADWLGSPIAVARTIEEALRAIGAMP